MVIVALSFFWSSLVLLMCCARYLLSMSYYLRYCPGCRTDASEVVLAGEKLKESKKKSKMASASSSSQRDWGKVSADTLARHFNQCDIFII